MDFNTDVKVSTQEMISRLATEFTDYKVKGNWMNKDIVTVSDGFIAVNLLKKANNTWRIKGGLNGGNIGVAALAAVVAVVGLNTIGPIGTFLLVFGFMLILQVTKKDAFTKLENEVVEVVTNAFGQQ